MLKDQFRVCYQDGNYNDLVTVPLVLFGHSNPPNLMNPFAWLKIFRANKRLIKDYQYDVAVLELGTDHPGDISAFADYLRVDIAVVTAIAPEHMEFFGTLDAVAKEELSVSSFSERMVVNKDLCGEYLAGHDAVTYGLSEADFYFSKLEFKGSEYAFTLIQTDRELFSGDFAALSEAELYSALAAVAVACQLDFPKEKLPHAMQQIRPPAGRMRQLSGLNGSMIIDDSYNASPEAVKASLKTLYKLEAPARIALLGNMNELGDYSERAHTEVGEFCDPSKLDLIITLGSDANNFLASAASKKGCKVEMVDSPHAAAEIIKPLLDKNVIVLAKGSQNGVFAEEAVKRLLANPDDALHLVRQSPQWLSKKAKQFPDTKVAL